VIELKRDASLAIDLFIIDTPPSLFGMSAAVRSLVERNGGVPLFVAAPLWQDLRGCWQMFRQIEEQQRAEASGAERSPKGGFVLNRCPWSPETTQVRIGVRNIIHQALPERLKTTVSPAQIDQWLEMREVAWLEESTACHRLAMVPYGEEKRPTLDEVLTPAFRRFAQAVMKLALGDTPA